MPKKGYRKPRAGDARDPEGLVVWARRYVERQRVRGLSPQTLRTTECYVQLFVEWAEDRVIGRPHEVTKPILEAYQRYLFYFKKPNGKPLGFPAQRQRLHKLRGFFRWLAQQNVILSNPASDLELPRTEQRLPRAILSEREVEQVLTLPDPGDPLGMRDRAMMETLYSTGIRRGELAGLDVFDLDTERGTLTVRNGKGNKDRTVPIGERALCWIERYIEEARPQLVMPPDEGILFLSERGERITVTRLTQLMRRYIDAARLGKSGACHIFRHTMATLMLENGADVRHIQEMLGHAQLTSTQIYTRVSIRHLKTVHDATHPGAKLQTCLPLEPSPAPSEPTQLDLFAALEAEAHEDDDDSDP
jgi:integrase/recombinase XerD